MYLRLRVVVASLFSWCVGLIIFSYHYNAAQQNSSEGVVDPPPLKSSRTLPERLSGSRQSPRENVTYRLERCVQLKGLAWGDNKISQKTGTSLEALQKTERWRCPPDYLGVGFPKCGSSSLWRYLKQHSNVRKIVATKKISGYTQLVT